MKKMIKIEKIIEILKAMEYNAIVISEDFKKDNDLEMEKQYIGRALGCVSAIMMLEDEEHAKKMANIYHIKL